MHRSATDFGIAMAGVCGMIFSSVAGGETRATPAVHDTRSPMVAIADEYLATLARMQPEFGTSEDLPGTDHGALTDNTEAGIARWRAYEDKVLARLKAIPAASLPEESDRVLAGVLRDELERSAGARVCRLELWGVASYVNGWQASLTDLARVQPVGSDALRRPRCGAPRASRISSTTRSSCCGRDCARAIHRRK